MAEKGPFAQNRIAVIWDFDKTLTPHYMQKPLFDAYSIDEATFWEQVNALPAYYQRAGIRVNRDTCYLGHLLSYVKSGRIPDLTNARLRELGRQIVFYEGLPEFFERVKGVLQEPRYADYDLKVEHYVVSTGLAEMVKGSAIAQYIESDGIWASEFIEEPAGADTDLKGVPQPGNISQIAEFLDNTTKTRALFEINKGVRKLSNIAVNASIPEEDRRVPFRNMIYIADGPSDIPSFSVVKKHGGWTLAVYDPKSVKHFDQAMTLQEDGRVHIALPADYRSETQTDLAICRRVRQIADRILEEKRTALESRMRPEPMHIQNKA